MEGGPKGAELEKIWSTSKKKCIRDAQSQNYKTKLQKLSLSEGYFYAYCVQVAGLQKSELSNKHP